METVISQVTALREKLYGNSNIKVTTPREKLYGNSDITGNSTEGIAMWRK